MLRRSAAVRHGRAAACDSRFFKAIGARHLGRFVDPSVIRCNSVAMPKKPLVVAIDGPPERIISEIRAVVESIDPELAVHRLAPMTEVVGRGARRERFALVVIATFCDCVADACGYRTLWRAGLRSSRTRTRDRNPGRSRRNGCADTRQHPAPGQRRNICGLMVGTVGALVLGRGLTSFTSGISPSDPRILAATAVLLTATGLLASWLPARRAACIEPGVAILRDSLC